MSEPITLGMKPARHILIADRLIEKEHNWLTKEFLMFVAGISEHEHGGIIAHAMFYNCMVKIRPVLRGLGYRMIEGSDEYQAVWIGGGR